MQIRLKSLVSPRHGRIAAVIVMCAALAACGLRSKGRVAGWAEADPTARHPILVGQDEEVLNLHVTRGRYGVTRRQANDLRHFMRRYRKSDEGRLFVRAPSGGPNEVAVMHALDDVRREFQRAGVTRRDVDFDAYAGDGSPSAPIKVSFLSYRAIPPECGDWSDNLARDPKNVPYRNLGCATQRNLAAMVSNPRDLVQPRTMSPRSSERRDVVWDKYVKGEATGAEKTEEEKAGVSEVTGGGTGG